MDVMVWIGLVNGLLYAGLLFMIASGFTLVFGLMRIVNMAHGAMYLLAAYLGWLVQRNTADWFETTTGSWLLGVVVAAVAVAVATVVLQEGLLRWVQGDELRETLLTLGVAIAMGDIMHGLWGGNHRTIRTPDFMKGSLDLDLSFIGGPLLFLPKNQLYMFGTAVVVGILLWLLMSRTQLGRVIRAGVDNRAMVSALGININRVFLVVMILAGIITGVSGVLGGMIYAFGPGIDMNMLTLSLIVVIVGGMGSLAGAALGALLVGVVDQVTLALYPEYSTIALFAILIVTLLLRPKGLLGRVGVNA